jgi:hypothetical protein
MASSLDIWVNKATRYLSKESAAQVRNEIGEHYEASHEDAVLGGANSADAERMAMQALGDAGKANRQYRDVLLTKDDAQVLREGNQEAKFFCANKRVWLALACLPGLALMAAALLLYTGKADLTSVLLAGSLAISFLVIVPRLPIYTASRSQVARIAKWMLLAALPVLAFGHDTLQYSWLVIATWGPIAWIEWRRVQLRKKLPIEQWPKQLYL